MSMRCPLGLTQSPCVGCPLGENTYKTRIKRWKRCTCEFPELNIQESIICLECALPVLTCHWAIKKSEYNYCMWRYLSTDEGNKIITNRDVSEFVEYTEQRVGQIIKIANKKILEIYGNHLERIISK